MAHHVLKLRGVHRRQLLPLLLRFLRCVLLQRALVLARDEAEAAARGWRVKWEDDAYHGGGLCSRADERYDDACDICGLLEQPRWGGDAHFYEGDSRCVPSPRYGYPACPGEHSVEWARLEDEDGNTLASLGGIVDADSAYRRVIEAELASEALYDVRRAARNDREAERYMAL